MDLPPQPAVPGQYGCSWVSLAEHGSLAVYSGRKRSKSKALLVPKICLPSVPSVQFDKGSHRSRRKIKGRDTDPRALLKEKVSAHRRPGCDSGLIKLVHCVSGVVMGSCHFLVRSSETQIWVEK